MGKNIEKTKFKEYAKEIVDMLERAKSRLIFSYNKVADFINSETDFDDDQLEIIESMCSRFARLNDILLQKAFRFLDIYELNGYDFSVPHRINMAMKRKLIDDELEFKYIRELRNEIAHNYATDYYIELFKEIYKYTPKLLEIVDKTKQYIRKKIIGE
ncbi:hypothetical protein D9V84_00585 [Bacteroidetes/Chlorobi group bacterium Naka2016]|jgi:hypothetical protein|nr:MAG: hypothetical protein D9V84_00585 [Bacteroidetes/Chlorobi group bacterium Naka2016]